MPETGSSGLMSANVRAAVDVQHLSGHVRSLGQIDHGIHDLLNVGDTFSKTLPDYFC
jgi:hypothetical protein